jgi:hypothetical protein
VKGNIMKLNLGFACILLILVSCSGDSGNNDMPGDDIESTDINEDDFNIEIAVKSGSNAVDCGHFELIGFREGDSGNREEVDSCLIDNFNANNAFFAIYDRQGIDSTLIMAITYNAQSEMHILNFDSNIFGAASLLPGGRIVSTLCEAPLVIVDAELLDEPYYPIHCTTP